MYLCFIFLFPHVLCFLQLISSNNIMHHFVFFSFVLIIICLFLFLLIFWNCIPVVGAVNQSINYIPSTQFFIERTHTCASTIPWLLFCTYHGGSNTGDAHPCTVPPGTISVKFIIGNLSYSPCSEPSCTVRLLDVMYTRLNTILPPWATPFIIPPWYIYSLDPALFHFH